MNWVDKLIKYCEVNGNRPCSDAIKWMQTYPDADTALACCSRGDWLLWLAVMLDVKREKIVLAACKCARQVLAYVPDGETIPLEAIETAEKWARGDATLDDVNVAYDAASDAYSAAASAAAVHATDAVHLADAAVYAAACASAYAAACVAGATYAAGAASHASACAAACAAAYAVAGDSREYSFRRSADIVREMIGEEMLQSWRGVLACYR